MDRKGSARILIGGVCAVLLGGAGAGGLASIHAAAWLAPSADRVRALGASEAECLSAPKSADEAYRVEVGRAAFRTPMILGGQAARAGVACESCHQGGRRNSDFDFPGLSGPPGTADVTSALFSSHRDDGIDNPVSIPDLSGRKSGLKISQDPKSGALEAFIHGLITQEFDGAEPPAAVLEGLAAYVRALSPSACPMVEREPVSAAGYVEEARRAVRAGEAALARGDRATAVLMIAGARWRLGLINERFDGTQNAASRALLHAADADLAAASAATREGSAGASVRLALWLERSRSWGAALEAAASGSLFDQRRLAAASSIP